MTRMDPTVIYHEEGADRGLAPNGLAYRELRCKYCGYYITHQAILMGIVKKRCRSCHKKNVIEVNRVGEGGDDSDIGAS